jgi:hypothetical protein
MLAIIEDWLVFYIKNILIYHLLLGVVITLIINVVVRKNIEKMNNDLEDIYELEEPLFEEAGRESSHGTNSSFSQRF